MLVQECAGSVRVCMSGAKQFYYGSLTKGSLVLLFDFLFSVSFSSCLISTLNLLMSVRGVCSCI